MRQESRLLQFCRDIQLTLYESTWDSLAWFLCDLIRVRWDLVFTIKQAPYHYNYSCRTFLAFHVTCLLIKFTLRDTTTFAWPSLSLSLLLNLLLLSGPSISSWPSECSDVLASALLVIISSRFSSKLRITSPSPSQRQILHPWNQLLQFHFHAHRSRSRSKLNQR